MERLSTLITKHFPNEVIKKQVKVRLEDTYIMFGGISRYFYLGPVELVETDKRYYFDRRKAFLIFSKIGILITPLAFPAMIYLLSRFIWRVPFSNDLLIFCFTGGLLIPLFSLVKSRSLLSVSVIKKEWIKETSFEKDRIVIKGRKPRGESDYFVHFLPEAERRKLSFFDKFFSGLIFGDSIKKLFISMRFVYKFREV